MAENRQITNYAHSGPCFIHEIYKTIFYYFFSDSLPKITPVRTLPLLIFSFVRFLKGVTVMVNLQNEKNRDSYFMSGVFVIFANLAGPSHTNFALKFEMYLF